MELQPATRAPPPLHWRGQEPATALEAERDDLDVAPHDVRADGESNRA